MPIPRIAAIPLKNIICEDTIIYTIILCLKLFSLIEFIVYFDAPLLNGNVCCVRARFNNRKPSTNYNVNLQSLHPRQVCIRSKIPISNVKVKYPRPRIYIAKVIALRGLKILPGEKVWEKSYLCIFWRWTMFKWTSKLYLLRRASYSAPNYYRVPW